MNKIVLRIAILAAAFGLAGRSLEAAGKSCTGLVVSSDGNPGHGRSSFSVTSDEALHFHLIVPASANIDAKDLVTIQLTTPNGHHYQTIDIPVAPAGSKETQRNVHGYSLPLKVQQFASTKSNGQGAQHVFGTIPLAGSYIESFSLYGKWDAQAQLGSGAPCSTSFTVSP